MKIELQKRSLMAASVLAATLVSAQSDEAVVNSGIILPGNDEPLRNRIGLSYRLGLNMSVDFKKLGGFQTQGDPGPPLGHGIDRFYDDGYNRVDSSGNAGESTWFWGYSGGTQVPGNDTILMHSSSSQANGSARGVDDDPQHGIELTYNRDLGALGQGRWGVEAAFGYMDLTFSDNRNRAGTVTQITDTYQLSGVVPPLSPYTGTFAGPGPLIGDEPDRMVSTIERGAMITGHRELDSDFYGFRLGPYWENPLSDKWGVSLSGGLSFAMVDSHFQFKESVSISDVGTTESSGATSDRDYLLGGYVSGNISFALSESVRLFTGAQYHLLGTYTEKTNGKKALVDFGNSVLVNVGLSYSF
jgi:hypothetical protein